VHSGEVLDVGGNYHSLHWGRKYLKEVDSCINFPSFDSSLSTGLSSGFVLVGKGLFYIKEGHQNLGQDSSLNSKKRI
jgi:hypothetical protein